MSSKRRGIRLKRLEPADPGLTQLRASHLGLPPCPGGHPPSPADPPPSPREVVDMVRAGLTEALDLLNQGLAAATPPRPPDTAAEGDRHGQPEAPRGAAAEASPPPRNRE